MPLDAGIGLEQEIRLAVHLQLAAVEDDRLQLEGRRVLTFRRPHVADVPHHRLDLRDPQRPRLPRLHVRGLAVDDLELVDLQRVHRLQRVLPAVVLHRRRVLQLGLEVRLVDVDERPDEREVGDELAVHERAPLHAGAQPLDPHHGWIRIRVLDELDVVEVDGEPDRMEVELADVGGVALHLPVHLGLGHAPQRLVDEERDDHGEDHDDGHRHREPQPVAAGPGAEPSDEIPHALPRRVKEQAQCQRAIIPA